MKVILSGLSPNSAVEFMAAVGAFRCAAKTCSKWKPRMKWERHDDSWMPVLMLEGDCNRKDVVDSIFETMENSRNILTRMFKQPVSYAELCATFTLPEEQAWLAALAFDLREKKRSKKKDKEGSESGEKKTISRKFHTKFNFLCGQQRLDKAIIRIMQVASREKVERALFEEWRRIDSPEGLQLRWDYAEYRPPAREPFDNKAGVDFGGYRLAIEALPLFPVFPACANWRTKGFSDRVFRYPIWSAPIDLDVLNSLLGTPDIPGVEMIFEAGIVEVAVSKGRYKNFAPARAVR